MPRKTKDIEKIEEKDEKVKTTKKTTSKTAEKKASVSSKRTTKKETVKKATSSKTTKKDINSKSKSSKKASTEKTKSTTKKVPTKKPASKTKKVIKKEKPIISPVEYYDLPYRYNQTVVKLLAQTPNTLFIYWDISDEDRENYKKTYGENFFEQTKPVLIVHNKTMHYSFEVDINDFANSWYLKVNDSRCDYKIELGRRPLVFNQEINEKIQNNYVYISSSNNIIAPNDKILFNVNPQTVLFKNTKTQQIEPKAISTISFMPHLHKMAKLYNIYDLYKKMYNDETLDDIFNPSSGNPSSGSFSSRFM